MISIKNRQELQDINLKDVTSEDLLSILQAFSTHGIDLLPLTPEEVKKHNLDSLPPNKLASKAQIDPGSLHSVVIAHEVVALQLSEDLMTDTENPFSILLIASALLRATVGMISESDPERVSDFFSSFITETCVTRDPRLVATRLMQSLSDTGTFEVLQCEADPNKALEMRYVLQCIDEYSIAKLMKKSLGIAASKNADANKEASKLRKSELH